MRSYRFRWATIAAILCAASNIVIAGSHATFADSWHDTLGGNAVDGYLPATTGSFSVSISLPLGGVDLSKADAGSKFLLSIGEGGNPLAIDSDTIVSDTLGDAADYSGKSSAKFEIQDQYTLANVGSVTVSWTATTISVTGSTSEDTMGEEFDVGSGLGVATNYSLSSAATGTSYQISLTLDASDNGGGKFTYVNSNVPVTGHNSETIVNPPDGSDPITLESGSITGTAVLAPPSLSITSPAANFKVSSSPPVIELKGQASDSLGVADIEYYVNGDTNNSTEAYYVSGNTNSSAGTDQFPVDPPVNSVSWNASVDLSQVGQVGSNLVTVYTVNGTGVKTFVSRTFYWIQTNSAVMTVSPSAAAGKVKGITPNQVLDIGASYSVTAMPASKDWIFHAWTDASGDILSSNTTFKYFDTDGTLTANFVVNPFHNTSLAGTYTGLFYDANGIQLGDAGYISVTVAPVGSFSGKLRLASTGSSYPLAGQLSVAQDSSMATADVKIKVNPSEYLDVNLQIDADTNLSDPGAGALGGSINSYSDSTELNLLDSAAIQGNLSVNNTNVGVGHYNVFFPPVSSDPSAGPGGSSYGSATVSKKGAVAIVLNLADGISPAISFSSALAQDGACPLFASLYKGKGVILGWMQFATDGSGTVASQSFDWVKLPVADKYYTNGFAATPSLSGSLYLPPKPGTNIFGWTDGTFVIDMGYSGLSLPDEIDDPVTFKPVQNTFANSSEVTINLKPATGALTGKFFYPTNSRTSFTFHAVEVGGAAYGFYSSTNKETGPIQVLGTP